MIAFLRGICFEKKIDSSVLIDVHGVGYHVMIPSRISSRLTLGEEVFVYTFHRIAEGINDLYGMETAEDLKFFECLISVSGIGPKLALAMSEMPSSTIAKAVEEEDIAFLTRIPGLGKKTASRLILELKGKLPEISSTSPSQFQKQTPHRDIILALETLGFPSKNITDLLETLPIDIAEMGDEAIIKWALRSL